MLLNCNCTKLADFEHFKTCSGGVLLWTQCIAVVNITNSRSHLYQVVNNVSCEHWVYVKTRAVQPVATCRQSPYLHKPAIVIVTSLSLWRDSLLSSPRPALRNERTLRTDTLPRLICNDEYSVLICCRTVYDGCWRHFMTDDNCVWCYFIQLVAKQRVRQATVTVVSTTGSKCPGTHLRDLMALECQDGTVLLGLWSQRRCLPWLVCLALGRWKRENGLVMESRSSLHRRHTSRR